MNPLLTPDMLARYLDSHLTHLDGPAFSELLHRLRFARECLDEALGVLSAADRERLEQAGLVGVFRQASGWLDDPQPNQPLADLHEAALAGWGRAVPQAHYGRHNVPGATAIAYAVSAFVEACDQVNRCRTEIPSEYDPRGATNTVPLRCRNASPAHRDALILSQWERARRYWPDMRPAGV